MSKNYEFQIQNAVRSLQNGSGIIITDDEARELLRLLGMPFKGMNKQA